MRERERGRDRERQREKERERETDRQTDRQRQIERDRGESEVGKIDGWIENRHKKRNKVTDKTRKERARQDGIAYLNSPGAYNEQLKITEA